MTILHVFPGIIGGVLGNWTRFKGIIEKSNSHHVILSSPATENITHSKQKIKKHGINYKIKLIYGYKYLKNRGGYFVTFPLFFVFFLFNIIRNRAKLVQLHNADSATYTAALASRCIGKPVIFEIHQLTSSRSINKNKYSRRNSLQEKYLAKIASKILVQTETMAKQLQKDYGVSSARIQILPNQVDTELFNSEKYYKERAKIRKLWGVKNKEIIFLYAGYINWYNGINELLYTFKNINKGVNAKLVIMGSGELLKEVLSASSEKPDLITYAGTAVPIEMPGIYAAADCVVMARPDCAETREATPMKLLEAMAMSRVVICSRVNGLTRICNNQTGIIVTPGDMDELKKSVQFIADNFENLDHMRAIARKRIITLQKENNSSIILDNIYYYHMKSTCRGAINKSSSKHMNSPKHDEL